MMKDLQEGATHFDPKAEEEARTLERITAMLPSEKTNNICKEACLYNQGSNEYRSGVIALLPQIIATAQRQERERILKIVENAKDEGSIVSLTPIDKVGWDSCVDYILTELSNE
jgi:hypothetical protein